MGRIQRWIVSYSVRFHSIHGITNDQFYCATFMTPIWEDRGEREVDAEGPPNKPNYHITLPYNICKTTTDDGEGKKTEGAFVPVYFDGISVQRFSARSAACTKFERGNRIQQQRALKISQTPFAGERANAVEREREGDLLKRWKHWHNFFSIIASMDEVVWT